MEKIHQLEENILTLFFFFLSIPRAQLLLRRRMRSADRTEDEGFTPWADSRRRFASSVFNAGKGSDTPLQIGATPKNKIDQN